MNYGIFGGQYVPQELKEKLSKISDNFNKLIKDKKFKKEYIKYLKDYIGRPSSLYYAKNLSKYLNVKVYLKREDLNYTGSHKINNALGQVLLAQKMGYKHIICETGAGQHGVAVATVCALFNVKCSVFMGVNDIKRQKINVDKIRMLGANIICVKKGTGTLKEAVDEAFKYFIKKEDSYYLIGSAVGPYPYPKIVKYFQRVIGEETRKQILEKEKRLPNAVIACVGGGSNSIGMFSAFINDKVDLFGVEAAGLGLNTNYHASAIYNNKIGILHGMKSYIMQDDKGNIKEAYSISAGLDYPGIGPEHAQYNLTKKVKYDSVTDEEAVNAFKLLVKLEGIIPALESSHAMAYLLKIAKKYKKEDILIVCLSGRGDKDINNILNYKKESE